MEKRVGIFGIGPGTVVPTQDLANATIFTVDRKPEPRSIYTTARGNEALFSRYVPQEYRLPLSEIRLVTNHGVDCTFSTGDRYFMVDYPKLVNNWQKIVETRTNLIPPEQAKGMKVVETPDGVTVDIDGTKFDFESVIDGTGIHGRIINQVDENRRKNDFLVEYVCCGTYEGEVPQGQLIIVFGPGNGTSWVNQSIYSSEKVPKVDVVFSGWGYYSGFNTLTYGDGRNRLDLLRKFVNNSIEGVRVSENPDQITYGMIRSQPADSPVSRHVFPVGEAAGVAKPKTGESFSRSLGSGQETGHAIYNDRSPQEVHRTLRKRWKGDDLAFAIALESITNQMRNNTGAHAEVLGKWSRNGKMDSRLEKQIELWAIQGSLSPRLVAIMLQDNYFRKSLVHAVATTFKIRVFGYNSVTHPSYGFPPLSDETTDNNYHQSVDSDSNL